jgi:saccharopine dehydrogenase-like NADP-dependent oxidoreductase
VRKMGTRYKIVIAGAGNIGRSTGLLLREKGDFGVDLFLGDARGDVAKEAVDWVQEGSEVQGAVEPFHLPEEGASSELEGILSGADILLDCLPGHEAPRMAKLARAYDLHYANLTEYVEESKQVAEIAEGAPKGFILQTGLAPGYINILGLSLFQRFCQTWGVEAIDTLVMRVGALTSRAVAPHFYGFTWSSIGVATEYVKPSIVVRNGERITQPSLSGRNTLLIDGVVYEEALTSGGAADLPDALAGRVRNLDYKTLRYPGHYAWVEGLLAKAPPDADPAEYLQREMEAVVPFVEDDRVVLYAAVEGRDARGTLHRIEDSRVIHPCRVGARTLKAIQATTSAGLAESARLLLTQSHKGVCLQSQIDPAHFMAGPFITAVYHR